MLVIILRSVLIVSLISLLTYVVHVFALTEIFDRVCGFLIMVTIVAAMQIPIYARRLEEESSKKGD